LILAKKEQGIAGKPSRASGFAFEIKQTDGDGELFVRDVPKLDSQDDYHVVTSQSQSEVP